MLFVRKGMKNRGKPQGKDNYRPATTELPDGRMLTVVFHESEARTDIYPEVRRTDVDLWLDGQRVQEVSVLEEGQMVEIAGTSYALMPLFFYLPEGDAYIPDFIAFEVTQSGT